MNSKTECAPNNLALKWDSIIWKSIQKKVRRLQIRIAKAIREGRYGRAKAIQWLLTHSLCAKLLAVRKVVSNKGKKTPGVDNNTWKTSGEKMKAVASLNNKGYRALPLLRTYIPKNNGKKRPLGIPTMKDRAMQALYAMALVPVAETTADPNSYGFREKRSTHDAIGQCFISLAKSYSPVWILDADIKACFDGISHRWLIENIPMDKSVLRTWLSAGYIERGRLFPTTAGTPQGGIISPTVANITLDGLEGAIKKAVPKQKKVNVIRYADDFVVTAQSKELLTERIIPAIECFLKPRGLQLSEQKTRIVHISEGFDFLGMNFRKYGTKLLIKPAKKSVLAIIDKVRTVCNSSKGVNAEVLIRKLNPIIRGWANYYKHVVSKKVFGFIDFTIFNMINRWLRIRHPNKSWKWIKRKYFSNVNQRSIFSTICKDNQGNKKVLSIVLAADTPIIRHIKVRGNANPYDVEYLEYFRKRAIMLNLRRNHFRIKRIT